MRSLDSSVCHYEYNNFNQLRANHLLHISLKSEEQMLNTQSPINHHTDRIDQKDQKGSQHQHLPQILSRSPYDIRPENQQDFSHRFTPLRKSHSMSLILNSGISTPNSFYIDQLERFRRNHDVKNKDQRDRQRELMKQKLQYKRNIQIQRQQNHQKRQEDHLRNMIDRNTKVLEGHKKGLIRNNTFNNSLPVNPITLQYESNLQGRYQKQADNRAQVRKLVRGHHLQTMGTSGYNILNGAAIDYTSRLVEKNKEIEGMYEQKLGKFYAGLKIRPPSLEETQSVSPRKGFKYD